MIQSNISKPCTTNCAICLRPGPDSEQLALSITSPVYRKQPPYELTFAKVGFGSACVGAESGLERTTCSIAIKRLRLFHTAWAISGLMQCCETASFDHLVGAGE
jgi:hypothetical protein